MARAAMGGDISGSLVAWLVWMDMAEREFRYGKTTTQAGRPIAGWTEISYSADYNNNLYSLSGLYIYVTF
jgi:hypothetical protein